MISIAGTVVYIKDMRLKLGKRTKIATGLIGAAAFTCSVVWMFMHPYSIPVLTLEGYAGDK